MWIALPCKPDILGPLDYPWVRLAQPLPSLAQLTELRGPPRGHQTLNRHTMSTQGTSVDRCGRRCEYPQKKSAFHTCSVMVSAWLWPTTACPHLYRSRACTRTGWCEPFDVPPTPPVPPPLAAEVILGSPSWPSSLDPVVKTSPSSGTG